MMNRWRGSEVENEPLSETTNDNPSLEQVFMPDQSFRVQRMLPATISTRPKSNRGRRSQSRATGQGGYYLRPVKPAGSVRDIALAATLRAAALQGRRVEQQEARGERKVYLPILPRDLRIKLRCVRTSNLILFVVDASGSMGARKRMAAVKGAILNLLLDAYQKRDLVGLIVFRGERAELLVPPTNSVELAERQLRYLPTGGRTPLTAGLQLADSVLTRYLHRDIAFKPLVILVTDGRANFGPPPKRAALSLLRHQVITLVLDSEPGFVRMGQARQIATWLGAEYIPFDTLKAEGIVGQVRQIL